MTPDLIIFGINSIIRLSKAGSSAAAQGARDAETAFPGLRKTDFNPLIYINRYFVKDDAHQMVKGIDAPFRDFWDQVNNRVIEKPEYIDTLLMLSIKIETEKGKPAADPRKHGAVTAGSLMVAQWREKDAPLTPWIGVIMTAADICLEYVSLNPQILDIGTEGEKIVGAYARELAALIPNDEAFGTQQDFGQRLGATFLKAGLNAVSENPGWLTDEEHVRALIKHSIAPLVAAFPEQTLMTQLTWSDVGNAVMGPVAAIAFKTVTEKQTTFLGSRFDPEEAIGAVTRAIFLEIADSGISEQFTRDGLVELSQAVFGVISDKPALLIGNDEGRTDELARALVSDLSSILVKSTAFDRNLTRQLAASAINTIGANANRFQDGEQPWHAVAADLIESVATTLSNAVVGATPLESILTQRQLIELGRIVIQHIGVSPSLILNGSDAAWNGVIIAIANGMEADTYSLLSSEEWLKIAALAAEEAVRNPARLFLLKDNQVLAGHLIKVILAAANEVVGEPDKASRSVLFGATLLDTVEISIRAATGNIAAVSEHMDSIRLLVTALNLFVIENYDRYGSKELLRMFRFLLQSVLDGATLPRLTHEIAEDLLTGVA